AAARAARVVALKRHRWRRRRSPRRRRPTPADLALRRYGEVVSELRALTAEHPLNERFHSQLMIALHGSGRRAEALEVYQKLRRVLTRELGLEPSVEAGQIHQAILRAEDGIEPLRAPLVAGSVTLPVAPA